MRKAEVRMNDKTVGGLSEDVEGYHFQYDELYLQENLPPVSLTLPKRKEAYHNKVLFSFFDGLIPEGWLLNIAEEHWKLDKRDRMGLLLTCCKDCIGAVSIHPLPDSDE